MVDERDQATIERQKRCKHAFIGSTNRRCVHCGVSSTDWDQMQLEEAMNYPFANIGTWGNHP